MAKVDTRFLNRMLLAVLYQTHPSSTTIKPAGSSSSTNTHLQQTTESLDSNSPPFHFPSIFLHKMQIRIFTPCVIFLALLTCAAAAPTPNATQDLVISSCLHARYPHVCVRTFSNYVGPAKTPKDLAQAAVRISLAHARRAYSFLHSLAPLSSAGPSETANKRQQVALSDCLGQLSDTVEELSKSLNELQHLRVETFQWQMSNAQTWVSAALTNGDTCLDGFSTVDGKLKAKVNRRINDVAKVTSNALYMINRLGQSQSSEKPRSKL